MIFSSKSQLIVALILFGQLTVLAHGAEFSDSPHTHSGVTCLALIHDEESFPLVTKKVVIDLTIGCDPSIVTVDSSINLLNINIKPPATGPPSL